MKRKETKFIIAFIASILIIVVTLIVVKYNNKKIEIQDNNDNLENQESIIDDKNIREENTLIFSIERKEEKEEEIENKVQKQTVDAATLTNEIYSMNREIGTLYIPKTGLTTPIYSSVIVEKMEQMPCFLYTTGGLNKIGTTLFVGHNRMNGKLFSENRKIEEGDEFYFKNFEGNELKYVVYSKFITTESDTSYLSQNVERPTIALSCCTDENNKNRIIILGKAE